MDIAAWTISIIVVLAAGAATVSRIREMVEIHKETRNNQKNVNPAVIKKEGTEHRTT